MESIVIDRILAEGLQQTLDAARLEIARLRDRVGEDKKPLTLAQAREYLQVDAKTLTKYINAGQITPSRFGSRVWVTVHELNSFIERNRRR